jgi:hypothetical protein
MLLLVLGWLVLKQPPDQLIKRYRLTVALQWIGLIILAGFAGFWGWFGIAEMVSDPSGFIHLLPIIPTVFLLYLGWRRPGIVGWGLVLLGLLYVALSSLSILAAPEAWALKLNSLIFSLMTIHGPFLISGLCLIIATRLARRFSFHEKAGNDLIPGRP